MFLIIVLLCGGGVAADFPFININVDQSSNGNLDCRFSVPRDLILYEEFSIIVNGNVEVKAGGCNFNENKTKLTYELEHLISADEHHKTHLLRASRDMNSMWKCEFFDQHYKKIKCTYDFNIVRNPDYGQLKINGMVVPINYTQRREVYHTFGNYSFTDSELAKISCNGNELHYNVKYMITLSYINEKQKIISGPFYEKVEMFVKLTKENEGAYVECNITKYTIYDTPEQYYVTRTYFQHNSTKKAILGFQVNGLVLKPKQKVNEHNLIFKYFYYDGEELEIISLKDEQQYGKLVCYIPEQVKYSNLSMNNSYLHLTSQLRLHWETSLKCDVDVNHVYYTRSTEKIASISLVLASNYRRDHYIAGLSMANILLQYEENSDSTVIYYEHDDTKNLSLKFNSITRPKIEHNYLDGERRVHTNIIYYLNSHYELSAVFELNPNLTSETSAVIKFISTGYVTRNTSIRLMRTNNRIGDNTQQNFKENGAIKTKVIFAACGIALFVAITITMIKVTKVIQKWKQTITIPEANDMNYDTLPAHNEGEMHATIQWSEEYAILRAGCETNNASSSRPVNEMYTTPLPKHLRQRPAEKDLTYAELQHGCCQDPTYATVASDPGLLRGAENYVKVLHKNKSPVIPSKIKSEVKKKSIDESAQAKTTPSDQYVNFFENESYINAHSMDNHESMYCEINVKK